MTKYERRKDFRGARKRAKKLDDQLAKASIVDALEVPAEGWIRSSRQAIGLTLVQLSGRTGISQPALTKLEQREVEGTISIRKLEAMAAGLDCDFVYGFVPRGTFEEMGRWEEPDAQSR